MDIFLDPTAAVAVLLVAGVTFAADEESLCLRFGDGLSRLSLLILLDLRLEAGLVAVVDDDDDEGFR